MLFLIDEDVHRSIANVLRELGHQTLDVRDVGLKGKSDQEIFRYAKRHNAAIITADLDFGDTSTFPLGSHHGIVLIRFQNEISTSVINNELKSSFKTLSDEDVKGNLVVVSPGKVRIRRKRPRL
jgi:predicted nuclease of predicted toxin-antitoxin system